MQETTTSLVLIDPTAEHGESALDLVELGQRVTLFLMLSGPTAGALEAFAANEGISVSEAADIYIEQVKTRLRPSGAEVEAFWAVGDDTVEEILEAADLTNAGRIAVPASSRAFGRRGLAELARTSPVPVMVAPAGGRAA